MPIYDRQIGVHIILMPLTVEQLVRAQQGKCPRQALDWDTPAQSPGRVGQDPRLRPALQRGAAQDWGCDALT